MHSDTTGQHETNIDSSKQQGKDSVFDELFEIPNTQTPIHNAKSKRIAEKYVPSIITQHILSKLKSNCKQPWGLLNHVPQMIQEISQQISKQNHYQKATNNYGNCQDLLYKCKGSVHFQNQQTIYIGSGTVIEHGAMIVGPCIIGKNCEIRKGAYIRGDTILGQSTLLGNSCEVKNSILMDYCQIAHFNYIGDSILGIRAHFAAGAITSNYKLDGTEIKIGTANTKTGRNKLGALVGHFAEIGCNAILNPGSVLGRSCVVYPMVNWRGSLKNNMICKLSQQQQIVERK